MLAKREVTDANTCKTTNSDTANEGTNNGYSLGKAILEEEVFAWALSGGEVDEIRADWHLIGALPGDWRPTNCRRGGRKWMRGMEKELARRVCVTCITPSSLLYSSELGGTVVMGYILSTTWTKWDGLISF